MKQVRIREQKEWSSSVGLHPRIQAWTSPPREGGLVGTVGVSLNRFRVEHVKGDTKRRYNLAWSHRKGANIYMCRLRMLVLSIFIQHNLAWSHRKGANISMCRLRMLVLSIFIQQNHHYHRHHYRRRHHRHHNHHHYHYHRNHHHHHNHQYVNSFEISAKRKRIRKMYSLINDNIWNKMYKHFWQSCLRQVQTSVFWCARVRLILLSAFWWIAIDFFPSVNVKWGKRKTGWLIGAGFGWVVLAVDCVFRYSMVCVFNCQTDL